MLSTGRVLAKHKLEHKLSMADTLLERLARSHVIKLSTEDGDVVEMEDASAKRRKISMSEVTAAFKSAGSTLAGTILLEFIDGADIPTSSASKPLSFLTPDPLVPGSLSNTSPCIQFIPSLAQPPSSPLPPPPPLLNPKFTRQDVLQKTVHANEERAKISIQGDKELHCLLLAEAKLSHQEVKKSQQRAKERHRLNIQQAEELHCMEMERLRLKMEFEAEMHRETLQAAKEKHERENRHSEETRRAQLRNLQGPSEHTE
uniref:Uncharacterized protein n=1 Tax=Timema monikensis TaxID=170555 RepID=A0A7R9HL97_9NEOP|nr:unnamed protein product [Timema monikensis]